MVLLILSLVKGSHRILSTLNIHGKCCQRPTHIPLVLTASVPAESLLLQAPASPCLRAFSSSEIMLLFPPIPEKAINARDLAP